MLTRDEREMVRAELEDVLVRIASALQKQFIENTFGADAAGFLTEVDQGPPTARDYSAAIVRVCLRDRWNHKPSFMEILLQAMIDRGKAGLVPIRDRVRQEIDPNLDPLRSSWITANQPFFGRGATRRLVKQLLDTSDKPILLVQGDGKSGKTYTGDWLDYLAGEDRCSFAIVVERLEKGSGPTLTADVLAESIVDKLGRPLPSVPSPPEKPHRWEKSLCGWIIAQALSKKQKVWIVLDGFDDPDLDRRTATLIQELAGAVMSGDANRHVRLILIDFRSPLAQVNSVRLLPDKIPDPREVRSSDMKDCLSQHLSDVGVDADDSFVEALAASLLADAEQLGQDPLYSAEPRMKRLNTVVYNFRQKELARVGRG